MIVFSFLHWGLLLAFAHDDRFASFAELARVYQEGRDYRIHLKATASDLAVVAIHGGTIEPGTLELARAVAGRDYGFYGFEGRVLGERSWDLHITSRNFDEPRAIEFIEAHEVCLSIHGFSTVTRGSTVWLGGLNSSFKTLLRSELEYLRREFPDLIVEDGEGKFGGVHARNVVNRAERRGAQVELSADLRARVITDEEFLKKFAGALRRGAGHFLNTARSRCAQLLE